MLLNNIDISKFKSILLNKDIQTAEVVIYEDWLKFSSNPTYIGSEIKYKEIKLELLVEGKTDEDALNNISNLLKQFIKCTIKFEDLIYYYDCLLTNKKHKRISEGYYTLDIELKSGYAYKNEKIEIMNRITDKTINVLGNLKAPAIIEVTPSIDLIDLTLKGLDDKPIILKNLKANKKLIVNGEDAKVTVDGVNKYKDTDMWGFPKLNPGTNTITVDKNSVDITIKYKPRYI